MQRDRCQTRLTRRFSLLPGKFEAFRCPLFIFGIQTSVFKVRHRCLLTVSFLIDQIVGFQGKDFTQDLTIEVVVTHVEDWPVTEDEPIPDNHKFVIGSMPNKLAAAAVVANGDSKPAAIDADYAATSNGDHKKSASDDDDNNDDDILEIVNFPTGEASNGGGDSSGGTTCAADAQSNGVISPPAKKKSKPADDVEVIEIDD